MDYEELNKKLAGHSFASFPMYHQPWPKPIAISSLPKAPFPKAKKPAPEKSDWEKATDSVAEKRLKPTPKQGYLKPTY